MSEDAIPRTTHIEGETESSDDWVSELRGNYTGNIPEDQQGTFNTLNQIILDYMTWKTTLHCAFQLVVTTLTSSPFNEDQCNHLYKKYGEHLETAASTHAHAAAQGEQLPKSSSEQRVNPNKEAGSGEPDADDPPGAAIEGASEQLWELA